MSEGTSITAVLGPTNTGKTHRAVERMLEHDTGMIGLPLRLLAREVYDRITARIGESRVALITGEEKRVPKRPSYWVCTVEAMPIEREVDFLAIDEIQLSGHEERGHVFTERVLSARGKRETWLLGADTMRPLVAELVPTARVMQHPRLSRLSYAGAAKLSRMPPRSALVAFSTTQVYEIAERLRAIRGGAAVVLGALSPRTRNAQVALFQSGEVDYLVATDAIGMGLNLDVSHVAFAALRKFDGRDVRDLDAAELAQIAGRAGRYLSDGTFGTIAPLALPTGIVNAIEAHRFPAVKKVLWRNAELDFTSIDALVTSLRRRPFSRRLKPTEGAEDMAALLALASDPDVRARARGEEAVGLLWDVCRVPDFRKLLLESHIALLAEIWRQLSGSSASLDDVWIRSKVAEIDDPSGDIETLIARIAAIRTWTYISNHTRWLKGAAEWQERTRNVEDRLSDALHDRLVQRFVERGGGRRAVVALGAGRPKKPRGSSIDAADARADASPSHPFARLSALRAALAPAPQRGSRSEGAIDEAWIEGVVAAPHERLSVDAIGRISIDDRAIGQLTRGPTLLLPNVRLIGLDAIGAGARSRVLRRLVAFARDLVEELLAPLRAPKLRELSPAGRGVLYQLEQGLGTAIAEDAAGQVAELSPRDRELFHALGVVIGERVIYAQALLRRPAIERRAALCRAYFEADVEPAIPAPGAVSLRAPRGSDPKALLSIGYPVFGARAVRADVVERIFKALADGASDLPRGRIASWVGCPAREAEAVAEAILPSTSLLNL